MQLISPSSPCSYANNLSQIISNTEQNTRRMSRWIVKKSSTLDGPNFHYLSRSASYRHHVTWRRCTYKCLTREQMGRKSNHRTVYQIHQRTHPTHLNCNTPHPYHSTIELSLRLRRLRTPRNYIKYRLLLLLRA